MDGISRKYTEQGEKNHERIFKKDIIDYIPLKIKAEIKKLNATEKKRWQRRIKKEISVSPEIIENTHEDKSEKF